MVTVVGPGCDASATAPATVSVKPPPAAAPIAAPAPGAAQVTHGVRNAGRVSPPDCQDHAPAAASAGPPTPLFSADDARAQGIDVSDAQGDVPWRTLHQHGLEFVYARASEGLHIEDKHFARNWEMARACGIPRGAYHVYEPTQDFDRQADKFLGLLGGDHGELPAVLDIEITPEMVVARNQRSKTNDVFPSHAEYMTGVLGWLARVEAATGRRPVIYIQPWYWHSYLGKSADLVAHRLWAAGTAPRGQDGWPWTFWQHGQPAHWDSRIWDRDLFHGTKAEFDALLAAIARPEP